MANTWKVGGLSLVRQGMLMLCLGMSLCVLGSLMANPDYDALCYGLAAGMSSVCLLIAGVNGGVPTKMTRLGRPVAVYLVVGASVITCWLIFWLFQSALTDIRLLVVIAGLHGLFWGLWYVKLAFHFQSYSGKAIVLCVLAGATSSLGIVLATWSGLSKLSAVTTVACYMTYMGIQIFLTAVLLHRESEAEKDFVGWQQREIEMDSTRLEVPQFSYSAPPREDWEQSL